MVLSPFREEGDLILELLADLDTLLNTNKDFLLGAWVKQAREAASSEEVVPTRNFNNDSFGPSVATAIFKPLELFLDENFLAASGVCSIVKHTV